MSLFRKKEPPAAVPEPSGPVTSARLAEVFDGCYDYERRDVRAGGCQAALCFIDGLISSNAVAELILRPLTDERRFPPALGAREAAQRILGGTVYAYTARERRDLGDAAADLLNGYCAVVFDGLRLAVTLEVKSSEKRSIDQPKEEKVVKGSKDAFIEVLKSNTALVRKKLRSPALKIRQTTIGRKTRTQAVIVYLGGFTNRSIAAEAERRLAAVDAEGVLSSAVIEENLADTPNTPFPQMLTTERPDKFCTNLLEGRVGILVDGLPVGFLVPGTFSQFFKVPEDHASHFLVASALTILRYLSAVLAVFLPAFYVAVAMYHQEMIPAKLVQSIIASRQSVPFPAAFEVLAMLISFELLQEAGLRLPNPAKETVSIIGALIVGQAAVEAKVVSPVVVIVIALSAIAGYTTPNQDLNAAFRLCRLILVILAILLGLFGLSLGCVLIVCHLASLESFGVPYMSPFAGAEGNHLLRALTRYPMKKKRDREPELGPEGK